MLHPQVIVYENPGSPSRQLEELASAGTGQLAALLTPLVKGRSWLLREPRQRPACLALLRECRPTLLALKLGRKLIDELTLLSEAHAAAPDVPILVVHDTNPGVDQRDLIQSLAFDLGASCVLFPPLPAELLQETAERLLNSTDREGRGRTAS